MNLNKPLIRKISFILSIAALVFFYQNFSSTSYAPGANGHASTWDNRFTILTRGEPEYNSGYAATKWDLCMFDPSATTSVNPSSGVDDQTRKIISIGSSYKNCIKFMSVNGVGSTFGYIPSINADGTANFTNPAYRSNIFEFNALAIVPTPLPSNISNPYKSNLDASGNSAGSYLTYDFYLYTQVYHLAPISNEATAIYPQNTFGVMRFQVVIDNGPTSTSRVRNIKLVSDWQPLQTTAGEYLIGIEPTLTFDGNLFVFQSFDTNNISYNDVGGLFYSYNSDPTKTNQWAPAKSITYLNSETATIRGQSFKSLYPLARQQLKSNLGVAYSPGETIRGAYPWVSWEGTDIFFTAANAYNNGVRAAWAVVGESSGGQIRLIDGAFREYADRLNNTSSTLVLFTSGIANTSSIWNPYKELKSSPFPVTNDWPVGLFYHSNGSSATEVSFKSYFDKRYLVHLNMNRALQKLNSNSPLGNFDSQYDLTKTPDTSGNNFYGSFFNSAEIPKQSKSLSESTEFHGEFAQFRAPSFIRSNFTPSKLNKKTFTVEMMVKPLVDLNVPSDNINKYIHLTEIPGVMNIILEENRMLQVTLYSGTQFRTGFISGSTLSLNTWSHVAVTWNEQTSRLRVYLNAVKIYDQLLPSGTTIGTPTGAINIGPMARNESNTVVIAGHDTTTVLLAIDDFKFSNIVRSQDELADSAFIPISKRNRPVLTLSSNIATKNFRVMGDQYNQSVAQLGSLLFRDNRLSKSSAVSCASCHEVSKAFTDGQSKRIGLLGTALAFNSPMLVNRVMGRNQTWDGKFSSSSEQMWLPIAHANEMGFSLTEVVNFLNSQADYKSKFQSVFGQNPNAQNIETAIAAFVNSPISSLSKFDRIMNNEAGVSYTASELAGKNLFFGKARCAACHNGVNFTDEQYHNTGIFNSGTFGLISISGKSEDNRKVKTPSLRHLNLTAPYFHDGSVSSLTDVVNRYIQAGNANDPLKSGEIKPINLDATERDQLVAFLGTLNSEVIYSFALNLNEALPGTGPTAPSTPAITSLTPASTQITVAFSAPVSNGGSAVTGYDVQAYNASSNTLFKTVSGSASPIVVTGLTNGIGYNFKIRAKNAIGASSYSALSAISTPATIPGAPTLGTPTAANAEANVFFTAPTDNGGSAVTGYDVQAYTASTNTLLKTVSGTTSPVKVTGLTNDVGCYFRVRAKNSMGSGVYSGNSITVIPKATLLAPNAPTNVTAVRGNALAQISFTAPTSNGGSAILDYTIEAYTNGSTTASITKSSVTVTSNYSFTGLTNGISYTFKVKARNSVGFGPLSTASTAVIPATVPNAPTMGTPSAGNTQISVNFTAPSNNGGSAITGYDVETYLVSSNALLKTVSGTSSPIVVTGLVNGTLYYFKVKAKNIIGSSAASNNSISISPLGTDLLYSAGELNLSSGQSALASNLKFSMQTDGNLVLYNSSNVALWASNTGGRSCSSGCKAVFQAEGNLVLYQGTSAYWASNSIVPNAKLKVTSTSPYLQIIDGRFGITTWKGTDYLATTLTYNVGQFVLYSPSMIVTANFKLNMQTDGNLVIYNLANQPLWASNTGGRSCPNTQCYAIFQGDGNFVIYNGSTPYFATATNGTGASKLTFSTTNPFMSILNSSNQPVWPAPAPEPIYEGGGF